MDIKKALLIIKDHEEFHRWQETLDKSDIDLAFDRGAIVAYGHVTELLNRPDKTPIDREETAMYVYKCIKRDHRYEPVLETIVHEEPTSLGAIEWLENNGGGLYRDILNNLEFSVRPRKEDPS